LVDVFHPASDLAIQALTAAARRGRPVYDLLYAALARVQGCATLTMDKGFAGLLLEMGMEVRCPLLGGS
jgi:predicted nucleic acid-binding protein